jgi:hypothetical protein
MLIAIVIPCLTVPGFWIQKDTAERAIRTTEKRLAAPFPELEFRQRGIISYPNTKSRRQFPLNYESWFNDHLAFRRPLIQISKQIELCGLIPSAALGEDSQASVTVGRNGWLYLAGGSALASYRCDSPLTENELDLWQTVLEARQRWLASQGIEFFVVVPPDKHTIYAEFLTRSVHRGDGATRLDQLQERLVSTAVNFIDLRPVLAEAKLRRRLYHRTDSHWNACGAFVGFQEIMRRVSIELEDADGGAQLSVPTETQFALEVSDGPGGDLAVMLDSPVEYREQLLTLRPLQPRNANMRRINPESKTKAHRVSLNESVGPLRAVIFHDSFMTGLIPFLNEQFERIDYVWTYELPVELVNQQRPHIVIMELVERSLYVHHPENPHRLNLDLRVATDSPPYPSEKSGAIRVDNSAEQLSRAGNSVRPDQPRSSSGRIAK